MKKLSVIFACLLLGIFILTGCGKKEEATVQLDDSVFGTWQESYFDSGYIFNSDGTGTDTFWDLTFTYTASAGNMTITYDSDLYGIADYTYDVDGDSLTMTRNGESDSTYVYEKVSDTSVN